MLYKTFIIDYLPKFDSPKSSPKFIGVTKPLGDAGASSLAPCRNGAEPPLKNFV